MGRAAKRRWGPAESETDDENEPKGLQAVAEESKATIVDAPKEVSEPRESQEVVWCPRRLNEQRRRYPHGETGLLEFMQEDVVPADTDREDLRAAEKLVELIALEERPTSMECSFFDDMIGEDSFLLQQVVGEVVGFPDRGDAKIDVCPQRAGLLYLMRTSPLLIPLRDDVVRMVIREFCLRCDPADVSALGRNLRQYLSGREGDGVTAGVWMEMLLEPFELSQVGSHLVPMLAATRFAALRFGPARDDEICGLMLFFMCAVTDPRVTHHRDFGAAVVGTLVENLECPLWAEVPGARLDALADEFVRIAFANGERRRLAPFVVNWPLTARMGVELMLRVAMRVGWHWVAGERELGGPLEVLSIMVKVFEERFPQDDPLSVMVSSGLLVFIERLWTCLAALGAFAGAGSAAAAVHGVTRNDLSAGTGGESKRYLLLQRDFVRLYMDHAEQRRGQAPI